MPTTRRNSPHLALQVVRRTHWCQAFAPVVHALQVIASAATVVRAALVALAWLTHLRLP